MWRGLCLSTGQSTGNTMLDKESPAQPSPNRLVVKFQADIPNRDGGNPDQKRGENALSCGRLIANDPRRVDVDQWIVCDVERIGQVSEEARNADRGTVDALLAGADGHNDREQKDDAERFVKAIDPVVLCASEARKRQRKQQEKAGDAECILQLDARSEPAEQNPCEKWEQKPREADVQPIRIKSPAANQVSALAKDSHLKQKNRREANKHAQGSL